MRVSGKYQESDHCDRGLLFFRTFDDNSLNVLLGAWCNPLKINSELYKNTEVCDYHWNDTSKLEKDYDL